MRADIIFPCRKKTLHSQLLPCFKGGFPLPFVKEIIDEPAVKNRMIKENVNSQNIEIHRVDEMILSNVGVIFPGQLFGL